MLAQITALRARQAWKREMLHLAAVAHRPWVAETVAEGDLAKLVDQQSLAASKQPDARHFLELSDSFSLLRDLRYLRRSRRWLWTKAAQSGMDGAYEQFRQFQTQNLQAPRLDEIAKADPDVLAGEPFQNLLET